MLTLTELFNSVKSDKGTLDVSQESWYTGVGYTTRNFASTYEKLFDEIRLDVTSFVEFGICDPRFPGASLKVWYEYFRNAKILGLDNFWDNPTLIAQYLQAFNNDRTTVVYCDQNKKSDIRSALCHIEAPNIIIDDGSHWPSSIMLCLATSFPYVRPGGYYVIEDLQVDTTMDLAYDNRQILEALTKPSIPRLYMSKEEHKYVDDNIANIQITYHNGFAIACITKK